MTEARGNFTKQRKSRTSICALVVLGMITPVMAQSPPPSTPAPKTPPSRIPEKVGPPLNTPPAPEDEGHQNLKRENGVIKPQKNLDPEMTIKPPDTGARTPVIPPPGTPGGDKSIQPK